MRISAAVVRDFQSIKEAKIDFGRFTALVGASSSGKSAFLRAVRACVRNTAVPANVRQGSTKSLVDVIFEDGLAVRIERGKSLSTYRLVTLDGVETFTKSGRSVPAPIEKALQLPLIADTDATFSFQFDRPFLLAETGSQAAQVIGSLTNVSLLHAAVREANRRRGEVSATLRVRKVDVESYRERLKDFADLPLRRKQVEDAEAKLVELADLEKRLGDLRRLQVEIKKIRAELETLEAVQPPDLSTPLRELEELGHRLQQVSWTRKSAADLRRTIQERAVGARGIKDQLAQMEEEYDAHLRAAGKCPICGAETSELTPRK